MKLKNKKTGQVGNFIINKDHFECVDLDYVPEYRNLAELNSEWEDVPEEPKEYWYIDCDGEVYSTDRLNGFDLDRMLNIDNCFNSREEAEKAVEKLKAWKRLKDKGFKLDAEVTDTVFCLDIFMMGEPYGTIKDDLKIVFGGEE